mmetsp:Transcript_18011/g.45157  ORF Transcript_18011/g.45157 Transcript_18011/m.45157 type:complete len:595 (-) Transcript_18011:110-1894(-)
MRDDDRGDVRERGEVVDDPLDVARVEVVGRLVEEQDVRLKQHGAHEGELHAPAAREAAHLLRERGGRHGAVVLGEADREQLLARHLRRDAQALEPLVVDDEVEHGHLGQLALHVRLHVHGAQLGRGREALDLLVGDGAHERGLARVVAPAEAVAVAALELELGLVEQHLVAVRERELAVAQLLRVVRLLLLLLDLHLLRARLQQARDHLVRVVEARVVEDRLERRDPVLGLQVLQVQHRERQLRRVRRHRVRQALDLARQPGEVLERRKHLGELDALPHGGLARGARELLVRLAAHVAALGVGDLLLGALERGQQHGHEGGHLVRVVDELGHVLDDARAVALGRGDRLVEAALEQRRHQRERRAEHLLHEDAAREGVHRLGHLLRLQDALDDLRHELLDVGVRVAREDGGDGGGRRRLDLRLGVPHQPGQHGHHLRQLAAHLRGRLLGEGREQLGAQQVDLPLAVALGQDRRQDRSDALRGERLDHRLGREVRLRRHWLHLVGRRRKDQGQVGHEERLGDGGAGLRHLAHGAERAGAVVGRSLPGVRQLSLELGHDSLHILGSHLLGHLGRGRLTVLRALSRCQLGKVNSRHSR